MWPRTTKAAPRALKTVCAVRVQYSTQLIQILTLLLSSSTCIYTIEITGKVARFHCRRSSARTADSMIRTIKQVPAGSSSLRHHRPTTLTSTTAIQRHDVPCPGIIPRRFCFSNSQHSPRTLFSNPKADVSLRSITIFPSSRVPPTISPFYSPTNRPIRLQAGTMSSKATQNGRERSPIGGSLRKRQSNGQAKAAADDHDHDSHSHSHSIFGHSHSHGEDPHSHSQDAEKIIAALKGAGTCLSSRVLDAFLNLIATPSSIL